MRETAFKGVNMKLEKITKKKQNGKRLSFKEIDFAVMGYTNGVFSDEQILPFIKAIFEKGMTDKETYFLTKSMKNSGEVLDLKKLGVQGITADKHSTGGVADTTTLVLVPLLASLGVKMIKMSGGSLGHTGGTAEKIRSFEGLQNELDIEKAVEIVNMHNGVFLTQSEKVAPADKKIYSLRDRENLVSSIPLIASSIASKKLATGAEIIVLDVKWGDGALMTSKEDATKLANLLQKVFIMDGKKAFTFLSSMQAPLGEYVGNELEAYESVLILKNRLHNNLRKVSLYISSLILRLAYNLSKEEADKKVLEALESKKALEAYKEIVKAQGGSLDLFREKQPYKIFAVKAQRSGFVFLRTKQIGEFCNKLTEQISQFKGIHILKKNNEKVKKGATLFEIFIRQDEKSKSLTEAKLSKIQKAFEKCVLVKEEETLVDETLICELKS